MTLQVSLVSLKEFIRSKLSFSAHVSGFTSDAVFSGGQAGHLAQPKHIYLLASEITLACLRSALVHGGRERRWRDG